MLTDLRDEDNRVLGERKVQHERNNEVLYVVEVYDTCNTNSH